MTSLPKQPKTSEGQTTEFFDKYYTKKLSFPSNEVDAVIGFFKKRGFDEVSAISTGTVILQQAKLDGVKVFELLDTLKGFDEVQLSAVVTEILNYNRDSTSSLGIKRTESVDKLEKRNIVI